MTARKRGFPGWQTDWWWSKGLEGKEAHRQKEEVNEHSTSNVQRRILNKVFYQFINRQSEATSAFDVQCSKFDVLR